MWTSRIFWGLAILFAVLTIVSPSRGMLLNGGWWAQDELALLGLMVSLAGGFHLGAAWQSLTSGRFAVADAVQILTAVLLVVAICVAASKLRAPLIWPVLLALFAISAWGYAKGEFRGAEIAVVALLVPMVLVIIGPQGGAPGVFVFMLLIYAAAGVAVLTVATGLGMRKR